MWTASFQCIVMFDLGIKKYCEWVKNWKTIVFSTMGICDFYNITAECSLWRLSSDDFVFHRKKRNSSCWKDEVDTAACVWEKIKTERCFYWFTTFPQEASIKTLSCLLLINCVCIDFSARGDKRFYSSALFKGRGNDEQRLRCDLIFILKQSLNYVAKAAATTGHFLVHLTPFWNKDRAVTLLSFLVDA